jgi:hypothetical protein
MTWTIKTRGDSKALIAAEYECPVHGRFEVPVPRDEVVDLMRCPISVDELYAIGNDRPIDHGYDLFCGRIAPFRFPCPMTRVQRVTAARRGKDPERPPGVMDWQAAAYDEKSPEEWHAAERKKDFEDVRKIVKEALR